MAEETSDKLERKKSVKKYASSLFKKSSVNAVSSILTTDSTPRRIFRAMIFIVFTTAFLYQCITFLSYLYEYPTVVNIDVTRPNEYFAPAFTMCHSQKFQRTKYCEKYPDHCTPTDKNFCNDYEKYCIYSNERVKEEYLLNDTRQESVIQLGIRLEDILVKNSSYHSKYGEEIWFSNETLLRVRRPWSENDEYSHNEYSTCFSANVAVASQNDPMLFTRSEKYEATEQSILIHSDLQFGINPLEEETFDPDIPNGIYFSVHSPFEAVNPFMTGHFLEHGKLYKVTITMKEEQLLPYPYKTDCLDYMELWLKNNRTGPRSQEMCQQKCFKDYISKCYNCFEPAILYPSDKTEICDYVKKHFDRCNKEEIVKECLQFCKDDCSKMSYFMEIREMYLPKYASGKAILNDPRHIYIEVYVDDREVLSYVFSPKYQNVEAFSYIGGFIGIWLGISLVQVTDFFESLFLICRYLCKKIACKNNFQTV